MSEQRFPILRSYEERRKRPDYPRSVPWSLIAAHERQAQLNHCGQTLERLAQRGGLSPWEMVAVVTDKRLQEMDNSAGSRERAGDRLLELLAEYGPARPARTNDRKDVAP